DGSSISGGLGNDAFGRFVAETLAGQGVDIRGLVTDPSRATSQTLIINVRGQDRRFIHSFGANEGLSAADLDVVLDPPPRILYVGGYLILPALEPEALAARFRRV